MVSSVELDYTSRGELAALNATNLTPLLAPLAKYNICDGHATSLPFSQANLTCMYGGVNGATSRMAVEPI
jgi:hypothetical protein